MHRPLLLLISYFLVAPIQSALAGEPFDSAKGPEISIEKAPSRLRFGVGYAPFIGLKTEFSGLGDFHSPHLLQPQGGGVDYNYDDGFVRVDSSGNLGGETWNWGYENQSQYDPANGGSVGFNITNSIANGNVEERDNAGAGFELLALLDMGALEIGDLKQRGARWGLRAGIHYARVNVDSDDRVFSGLETLTDRFSLGGSVAPLAPYAGSFGGPGVLISDVSNRSISTDGRALVMGTRELDANLTTLNIGSYLDLPVNPQVALNLEAGVSMTIASGDYDFKSTTAVEGLGTQNSSGSASETSFLMGLYLGAGGSYRINSDWAVQLSARYQFIDDFEIGANGSKANLSFDSAFVVSTALVYSF